MNSLHKFNNFELNCNTRVLFHRGNKVEIQNKSMELLIYLIDNRDRAISKDELLNKLWKGRVVSESVLSHAATKLRSALKTAEQEEQIIRTVYGFGLQFVGDIETVNEANEAEPGTRTQSNPVFKLAIAFLLIATVLVLFASFNSSEPPSEDQNLNSKIYFQYHSLNTTDKDWLARGLTFYLNQILTHSQLSLPIPIDSQIENNEKMGDFFAVNQIIKTNLAGEKFKINTDSQSEPLEVPANEIGKSIKLINQWICTNVSRSIETCQQNLEQITSEDAYILESYFRGISSLMNSEPSKAISYLQASIQHDSTLTFARLALASAYIDLSDHTQALAELELILSLTKNPSMYYEALAMQAKVYIRKEQHKEAHKVLKEILSALESPEFTKGVASLSLAQLLMNSEQLTEALHAANESLRFFQDKNIPLYIAQSLEVIGTIEMSMGKLVESQDHLTQALKRYERLEYVNGIERVLSPLGLVHQSQGQLQPALIYGEQRLVITKQMKDPISIAGAHLHLANLLLEMGDFSQAMSHADSMWEIVISEEEPQALLLAYFIAGEIARADQKYNLSLEKYQKAFGVANKYQIPFRQLQVACTLGATAIDANQLELAESYLQQCRDFAVSQDDLLFQSVSHLYTSQLNSNINQIQTSLSHLNLALEKAQSLNNNHLLFEIHLEFFYQYIELDRDKAEFHLLKIPEDYQDGKDYFLALAQLEHAKGDLTEALEASLKAKQIAKDNWSDEDQLLLNQIKDQLDGND